MNGGPLDITFLNLLAYSIAAILGKVHPLFVYPFFDSLIKRMTKNNNKQSANHLHACTTSGDRDQAKRKMKTNQGGLTSH